MVFEKIYRPWMMQTKLRRQITLLAILLWLMLQGFGFRMEGWQAEKPWRNYAQQIGAAEARVRTTGKYEVVHVEGTPDGFDFDLLINQASAKRNN